MMSQREQIKKGHSALELRYGWDKDSAGIGGTSHAIYG
mgnify:FL=1